MDNVLELLNMLQRDIVNKEPHGALGVKVQNIRAELVRAMSVKEASDA